MKTDNYKLNHYIEKIIRGSCTDFLDEKECRYIKGKLKGIEYKEYYPYPDSEKIILYVKELPEITLLEIENYQKIRHQDILGSIFALGLNSNSFGDIVNYNEKYYIYILTTMANYVIDNLIMIGSSLVKLKKVNVEILSSYKRQYQELQMIVSSSRIDSVVAKIINNSRSNAIELIKKGDVIVNYENLNKNSYFLKTGDTFSIRRFGKYKFIGIVKSTKKDNYIIKYLKY